MQVTVNYSKEKARHFYVVRVIVPAMLISLFVLVSHGTSLAQMSHATMPAPETDAQKAFTTLKTLAGSWEGPASSSPVPAMMAGLFAQVSLRVTSTGNALTHEITMKGRPDDPLTMFYLEDDRFLLTHYCDAGNRPRMTGKLSADGKTLDFEFVDIVGSTQRGHMHHATFTLIDANHHAEDWTYMLPNDKPVRAHFELQRAK